AHDGASKQFHPNKQTLPASHKPWHKTSWLCHATNSIEVAPVQFSFAFLISKGDDTPPTYVDVLPQPCLVRSSTQGEQNIELHYREPGLLLGAILELPVLHRQGYVVGLQF